jgi:S-adenosylmethionine uptake transporter
MLLSGLFFAAMAICVSAAHQLDTGLSTYVTTSARALVNLLLLVVLAEGSIKRLLGDMQPALWARGVLGAASLLTYFAALERIDVGKAAFLNQTSAAWVALLAPGLLGEPTRKMTWLSILSALLGAFLLAHPGESSWSGSLLGLASGLCAALAYLTVRKAGASNEPITIVFYFTALSSVLGLALMLATKAALPTNPISWVFLVGSGIFATLGQILMTRAYQLAPAALAASVSASGPMFSTLGGWVFLAQSPDTRGIVGMIILAIASIALPFF